MRMTSHFLCPALTFAVAIVAFGVGGCHHAATPTAPAANASNAPGALTAAQLQQIENDPEMSPQQKSQAVARFQQQQSQGH